MTDRLYGNWMRPQRASIRGVGLKGVAVAAVTYLIGLATLQANPRLGATMLAVCVTATAASAVRIGGSTLRDAASAKARWHYATATGRTRFRSLAAQIPDGRWRLPGPLAGTRMIDVHQGGRRYGAVHDPTARRIAVTLDVASTAANLVDDDEHDHDVARWERWLESLGRHDEVAWVSVHVDTAPSPGTRLAETVQRRLAPDGPVDCLTLMAELTAASPTVAASVQTRVTITFDVRAWDAQVRRGARRDVAAYLPLLDHALAGVETALHGCGVTVTGRATSTELGAAVRVAFDPAASGHIELALGDPRFDMPGWEQAGPAAAVEHRDRYVHDSGVSASFVWTQAPRQLVGSHILDPLTRPGRFRKRITVTYHATPTANAMDAATAQLRWRRLGTALAGLPVIGRASTAQDDRETAAATQAGQEVAAGGGWIAQTITATTTVLDQNDLTAAVSDLEHAAGTAQLRIRRLFELQAAGFAAGLPIGLSLPELARRWER